MTIHYIWVGPPKSGLKHSRQDIAAPIQLGEMKIQQTIKFWCLDQYVEPFRKTFNDTSIMVIGIETFLKKLQSKVKHNEHLWVINRVQHIVVTLRNGVTRDRVNVKNAFAFFLMWHQGGYIFDTNVKPKNDVSLQEYDDVKVPAFPLNGKNFLQENLTLVKASKCIPNAQHMLVPYDGALHELWDKRETSYIMPVIKVDCWGMFSPQLSEKSLNMLKMYIALFPTLIECRRNFKDSESQQFYHGVSAEAALTSIYYAFSTEYAEAAYEHYLGDEEYTADKEKMLTQDFKTFIWPTHQDRLNSQLWHVSEINVEKTTSNTHKFANQKYKKIDVPIPKAIDYKSWHDAGTIQYLPSFSFSSYTNTLFSKRPSITRNQMAVGALSLFATGTLLCYLYLQSQTSESEDETCNSNFANNNCNFN